ncbi:MAG: hypothetical protein P4L66_15010 [Acetobacteraceae bacterium]|nr:hypothetical protein [Acetobacteraceae bacterium]
MPTTATHVWRPSGARRVVLDGFAVVPRGTVPAAPAPLVWPSKDPNDVLDYEFEIAAGLLGNRGDGIATLDVSITPTGNAGDLVLNSATADGAIAVFWFSAGNAGTNYVVQVSVGTTSGRTLSRAVILPVLSLSTVSAPIDVLTSDTGAIITDQNGNPIAIGG